MKKMMLIFGCFIFLMPLISCAASKEHQLCFDKMCFDVEIMRTDEERQKGLMYRDSLSKTESVLFVFEKSGDYVFWMKNVSFPIDILWIDENRRIVHMESNVPPCQVDPCPVYRSQTPALYVVELAAQVAEAQNLHLGDRVTCLDI